MSVEYQHKIAFKLPAKWGEPSDIIIYRKGAMSGKLYVTNKFTNDYVLYLYTGWLRLW